MSGSRFAFAKTSLKFTEKESLLTQAMDDDMIKNTSDARTLRTQALLKQAMIEQLENKKLHEITVSSLCRISQINRVTFYDHYRDVFDQANAIENDLIDQLKAVFQKLSLEEAGPNLVSDTMFEFLDEHRKVMLLLLQGETGTSFRNKFYGASYTFFETQLEYRYQLSEESKGAEIQNIMHYVASGYDYFFTRYLEDPGLDYHAVSALCTRLSSQVFLSWKEQ